MNITMKGLNVLLTGASRGIGKAVAEGLGRAGATVALHYNQNAGTANDLAASIGNGSIVLQAELGDPNACIGLFREAVAKLGHLDVLINNAGISPFSPIDMTDEDWIESWDNTLNVNLRSVGILCREAVKHFQQRSGGRIINVASRAAFRGDSKDYYSYAASKGGMVALTRTLARAYGKDHIVAFTIAPGFVRTDMAQPYIDDYGEEYVTGDLALPNLTEPEDVAPTLVFLAAGMADHATGATYDINAGSYVH